MAKRPNKGELARMRVMSEMGVTPTAISKKIGRSHHTVKKYLDSDVFREPDIKAMVEKIKENEVQDLYLLGAKARYRLHQQLDDDEKAIPAIPLVAIADRFFNQRRLLEGASTSNIHSWTALVKASHKLDEPKDITPGTAPEEK